MKLLRTRSPNSLALLAAIVLSGCVTTDAPTPQAGADRREGADGSQAQAGDASGAAPRILERESSQSSELVSAPGSIGVLTEKEENFSKAVAHHIAGALHSARKEEDATLAEWDAEVRLDPSRKELRDFLVQEYFRKGQFKKAADLLEVAVKQETDSVELRAKLAVALRGDQQTEKAVESAEKAIEMDPSQILPYEVLFEVAVSQKDFRKAQKIVERAAGQKSDDIHFWLDLAELYKELKAKEPPLGIETRQISALYDRAAELQPNDANILVKVAEFHAANQDLDKAITILEKLLAQQPYLENVRRKLALAYELKGDLRKAAGIYEEIIKSEPYRYDVFNSLARLYDELHEPEKALNYCRSSLQCNEKQLDPRIHAALILLQLKRDDDAMKELATAAERFPNSPQVSFYYGIVYTETKQYAKAVKSIEEALRLAESSSPDMLKHVFYYQYGAALERNGEFDKAVAQFRKALEMNPDYANAYNYLGFMFADKNVNIEEASKLIEKALSFEPENGAFLDSMGWVYYRQGKFDKAVEYIQRAIKTVAKDSVVFDHLADALLKLGKRDEALANYQKAAELDPKNKEISEKLEVLRKEVTPTPPGSVSATPASSPDVAH